MAGFLKKVFSFGRKQVVEAPAEEEPLAPINWEALREFQPEPDPAKQAADEAALRREAAVEAEPSPPLVHIVEAVPDDVATRGDAIGIEDEAVEAASSPSPADIVAVEPVAPVVEQDVATKTAEHRGEQDTPALQPTNVVAVEAVIEPVVAATKVEPDAVGQASSDDAPSDDLDATAVAQAEAVTTPAETADRAHVHDVEDASPAAELQATPGEETWEAEPPVRERIAAETPPLDATVEAASRDAEQADSQPVAEAQTAPLPPPPEPIPPPTSAVRDDAAVRTGKVTVAKTVAEKAAPATVEPAAAPRQSWLQRMRAGLARSSRELTGNITGLFTKRRLDEDTLQDLEDVLIRADLGVETALRITDALASGRYGRQVSDEEVRAVMADEIGKVLTPVAQALELDLSHKPHVILVVGVNGTGKTTTIGKLAAKLADGGLSVMLAAGDTFRAAAIEQLKIWGDRTGAPVVSSKLGADAAGLAYDGFVKAKEAGSDVLIIDTAGRLQNKTELMAELEKIVRVLGKLDPDAPHTVLQTVDATTGQNALNQVEIFRNVAGVNGLVMTKLDGTARGGILVGIAAKYKLPVYFIGVGEQVDDLEPFSATDFAKAIAGIG